MSTNILVEIPWNNIIKLRNLYKENWPINYLGFYTLSNYIRWYEADPDDIVKHVKIFSLNGQWENDGTFVMIDRYQIFFNTLNPKKYDRLQTALSLMDFSQSYILGGFSDALVPIIKRLPKIKNINFPSNPLTISTICYYLRRTDASKFVIRTPDHIHLGRLNESDAKIIDELWGWKHQGSIDLITNQIRYNISLGTYTDSGELVGWCIRAQPGSLGALYVKKEYRRYGLGTVIVKGIAKLLSDNDEDCFATVFADNYPSRNLFEKLGFQNIDNLHWQVIGEGKEFL